MKRFLLPTLCLLTIGIAYLGSYSVQSANAQIEVAAPEAMQLVEADNENIQYTGRIDFSDPKKPKFSTSGVYIRARFEGTQCEVLINDELFGNKQHNYLEIVVDDREPIRVQTSGPSNTLKVGDLPAGEHTITVCKDTESSIGTLEFVGFRVSKLLPPPPRPVRKLEFYGDSITCGASSDLSQIACKTGPWYDQHNAYQSYGASTARLLNAEWQLTSVSGIRLTKNVDNRTSMPEVFNTMHMRKNGPLWDFKRYQPDAVMVCLGQNDGAKDAEKYRDTYLEFIASLRQVYPQAQIVCLSSPMADDNLKAFMKDNITQVVESAHRNGDAKVSSFFFSRSYWHGCGGHPNVAEHQLIAAELSKYLAATVYANG